MIPGETEFQIHPGYGLVETRWATAPLLCRTRRVCSNVFAKLAIVLRSKYRTIRERRAVHSACCAQGRASEHTGRPATHRSKSPTPSMVFTMSINRISRAGRARQNPPVGPLLERRRPLRAISWSIFARKCAGIDSFRAMFFTIAHSPSGSCAKWTKARIAYSQERE